MFDSVKGMVGDNYPDRLATIILSGQKRQSYSRRV